MSEIKLVLTDFDGTVVQLGKHVVSERVREAVIACENKGIKVVAVTGRFFAMAQPVLEILGFDDLCIFDNGASIMHAKTGELVWSKWLEAGVIKEVAKILAPVSRIIDYTEEHDEHIPADNELERIGLVNKPASHVFALVDLAKVEAVDAALKNIPGITYYWAASTHGYDDCRGVQVNHVSADKFHGVAALRDILNVPKEHTLAIGDGDNDIPLFQNAGIKVAMGNASAELKALADHVVASVDDDGFVEAMERFVLKTTPQTVT